MDDLISRQAAIDDIRTLKPDGLRVDAKWIEMWLNQLPSAQPEPSQVARDIATIIENDRDMRVIERVAQPEIIRCKDCKWKEGAECVRFADVRPFPDDFCSRAERRTDDK